MSDEGIPKYQCGVCGEEFYTEQEVNEHVEEEHDPEEDEPDA